MRIYDLLHFIKLGKKYVYDSKVNVKKLNFTQREQKGPF